MKTAAIPTIRVTPELRGQVEDLLAPGESLSAFVEDAIRRSVDLRQAQRAFVARGLRAAADARAAGNHVPADEVIERVGRAASRARNGRAADE